MTLLLNLFFYFRGIKGRKMLMSDKVKKQKLQNLNQSLKQYECTDVQYKR